MTRNIMHWLTILLIFASGVGAEEAKIVVPEATPPFKSIVAKIVVPNDPYSQVITSWSADEGTAFRSVRVEDADELDIWATPGKHWLKCIVVIHKYKDQTVVVPDEQDPTNTAKYKTQTIRVTVGTSIKEYRESFTVLPVPVDTETKPKTDTDTGTKTPTDEEMSGLFGFAIKVRDKGNLVSATQRGKAAALSEAYRKAAIEVIEDKLTILNAATRLKALNGEALPTDADKAAWNPILDWLGAEMTKLGVSGKLTSKKDVVAALSEISLGFSLVK